jgi:hypothetical protein
MKAFLKTVFAVVALAGLALAADKPDFSGEWKMDASKSNLGPMPPPDSMVRKVEYKDPTLTITEARVGGPQGDVTTTMKYSTDGKETTNSVMGNDAKAVATWEGAALVIKTKLSLQGNDLNLIQKLTLSDDGKVLTDAWHIAAPQGEFDMTYVLNKQ